MSVRPLWRVGLFAGGLCVSHSDFPSRAGMEGSPMPCRHLSQDRPARPSEFFFSPPDLFRILVNSLPQVGLKTPCQTELPVARGRAARPFLSAGTGTAV